MTAKSASGVFVSILPELDAIQALQTWWYTSKIYINNTFLKLDDHMHVTLINSNANFDVKPSTISKYSVSASEVKISVWKQSNGQNCIVLELMTNVFDQRVAELVIQGGTPKHTPYCPHLTLAYNVSNESLIYLTEINPIDFSLTFQQEVIEPVK